MERWKREETELQELQPTISQQETAGQVIFKLTICRIYQRHRNQAPLRAHFCGEGGRKREGNLLLLWQRVRQQGTMAAACREEKLPWVAQNHLSLQPLWENIHQEGQP